MALSPLTPSLYTYHTVNTQDPCSSHHRFSQLNLEQGELPLQDWCVLANSNIPDPDTKLPPPPLNKEDIPPSTRLDRIKGRLRLCSKSLVFDPNDKSRGLVRCPLSHMPLCPSITKHHIDAKLPIVTVSSTQHIILKTNNMVVPNETLELTIEFQFQFLHSHPRAFLTICEKLYQLSHTSSNSSLTDLLRPMLDTPFDPLNYIDMWEVPQTSNHHVLLLTPLSEMPHTFLLTEKRLYLQACYGMGEPTHVKAQSFLLRKIRAIAHRYHGLKDCAVEVYFEELAADHRPTAPPSILLSFDSTMERDHILTTLNNEHCNVTVPCHTDRKYLLEMAHQWRDGKLSNFDYLLALNSAAGRNFQDLSHYPIVPWVLSQYDTPHLNLHDPSIFRDLSKPIGALTDKRLKFFMDRYDSMTDQDPLFLYGTHFMAPGYVLYYLVRSMPEHMMRLQNGKYDAPDRLFHSLSHCYSSVLTNPADVKELIPQFYDISGGSDFLWNVRALQFGSRQDGTRVNDVILPPWAKTPNEFIRGHREALECEHVSGQLPKWIDLMFGVTSRGEKALEVKNLFHPTAYLKEEDLEKMGSVEERNQAELHAMEFGIVPDQLFVKEHPGKAVLLGGDGDELFIGLCERRSGERGE